LQAEQEADVTSSPDGGDTALRARAILDLGEAPVTLEFDAVTINTDSPDTLVVALADAQGRTLTLLLPKQEVKKLLSWRTLMSL
jgi:hypothetical protein